MNTKVALTGAVGNMGRETLIQLLDSEYIEKVKILILDKPKDKKLARKWKKKYGDRLEIIVGDLSVYEDCVKLIEGTEYVLNLAAVIPPHSDKCPELARKCNVVGAENIVKAIECAETPKKFIHISSVAVYGNRNHKHPWGRVGDPLLPSVYDCYAMFKLRGERFVLESKISQWAILRQTAMLHNKMLADNMSDGLMFHTCYNTPLEWVTARDSGRLMVNIIEKDLQGKTNGFWKKVYNIGGGAANRITGFDTFDEGFKIIGGSGEQFLSPAWNSVRNFHGLWFYDSDVLQDMFDYQKETTADYWKEILSRHPYYKVAKFIPAALIRRLAIQRLLTDANAPKEWIKQGEKGKVKAYFGSEDNIRCLPKDWETYPLLCKGRLADGDIDYDRLRNIEYVKKDGYLIDHGYDETKPDEELTIEDMKAAAKFRGGECLSESMTKGDLYTELKWKCHEGHEFSASPYTIIKAGHWCKECTDPKVWDFDMQAKYNRFYAQVWYDSHAKQENATYYFDSNYKPRFKINNRNI